MTTRIIKTGVSALYKQKLISYSPLKENVEMVFGTNTSKYKDLVISTQKETTLKIGVVEIDDEYYYCPERLFIELNKFPLENTVKEEAIRNLKKNMKPELVKVLYDKLKKHRRNLDNKMIEEYLNQNLLLIKDVLSKHKDKKTIIREYLMALVSSKEVPLSLIKGGSSIELYLPINRTTLDVDTHTDSGSIKGILDFLFSKERPIYFKMGEDEKTMKNLKSWNNDSSNKLVLKISLVPISRGGSNKDDLQGISIPISFNTTYSSSELKEFINDYKISKKRLKYLPNASAIVFSKEMLLAEKFQSLITKPDESKRTKDLIDLKLLWDDSINFNLFRKWLFRKWESIRHNKTIDEAISMINKNKDKPFTKIQPNFKDAVKMYETNITYDECISIYNKLIIESTRN